MSMIRYAAFAIALAAPFSLHVPAHAAELKLEADLGQTVLSTAKPGNVYLRLNLKSLAASVPTLAAGYCVGRLGGRGEVPELGLLVLINGASIALIFQVHMVRAAKWCCAELGLGSLSIVACGLLYVVGEPIWRLLQQR